MNITLKVNRLPTNTMAIPDTSVIAHQTQTPISISCSTFTDADGDSVTVNMTTSPSLPAVTLSYTSPCQINIGVLKNSDAINYTVTLHAYDYASTESQHATLSFNLEVTENTAPYNSSTASDISMVAYSVSPNNIKNLPVNLFVDDDGDNLTYTVTSDPPSSLFVYDPISSILVVPTSNSSNVGSYNVTIEASDSVSETANCTTSFLFNITTNLPPTVNTAPSDAPCIIAHYPLDYSIPKTYFSEPDSETIIYSFTSNQSVAMSSWIAMTENDTHVIFGGTPDNTQFGNYTVTLMLDDGHDDVANATTTFQL